MTEKHHGYTNHGHPIPGACGIAGQRPKYVARCGGPGLCGTCSLDAERYNESRPDSNEPPTMTDQTPSTEDVRWKYRCMRVKDGAEDIAAQTEFNAWLAAHDREVAAKALREMSRKLVEMRLDPNLDRHASDYWSGVFQGLLAAEQYVSDEAENARSDRMEAGE